MSAVIHESQPLARILDVSEAEYHSDPCEAPSLSQSIGRLIVAESPLHAWQQHPKLGKAVNSDEDEGLDERDKWAQTAGKIMHKLMLGKGEEITVINADSYRTNYAKDERDAAKSAGRIPVLAHKYQGLVDAADYITERLDVIGYPLSGESEVAFQWIEDGANGPVVCRGRMDNVTFEQRLIYDLKKIRSANPQTIQRAIYDHGYDIQREAYTRCMAKFLGCDQSAVRYVLLFVEEKPPHAITPVELSPAFLEIGRMRWERAVLTWEKCLATNRWPDYADGKLITIEPAPYVLTKEIGSEW